jgi:hypothetical protein
LADIGHGIHIGFQGRAGAPWAEGSHLQSVGGVVARIGGMCKAADMSVIWSAGRSSEAKPQTQ